MYHNSLNTHQSHSLIAREQNYILDRKLISIHSEDRDIKKWPNSNHFTVQLPEPMNNVQSMRVVECSMPINYYVFMNKYQNTKFSFTLEPQDPSDNYYTILQDNSNVTHTITIPEGYYHPEQLANELQGQLNLYMTNFIQSKGSTSSYSQFKVYYNYVSMKFWFGNIKDKFTLLFGEQQMYQLTSCEQPNVWNRYLNWGFPFFIGYEKKNYISQPYLDTSDNPIPIIFHYNSTNLAVNTWMSPISTTLPVYYVEAPFIHNTLGERIIYMEVIKYNSYDELKPYVESTTSLYNNDYNGTVNSAFAKIPVTNTPYGEGYESRNGFLQNISYYDPPIEKISKLEFIFRYHDGRLVEFNNFPFNFTIEFNQLKNEIPKKYKINVPPLYSL